MLRDQMTSLLRSVANLPKRQRRVVLATIDLMLLTLVVWFLMSARYWTTWVPPDASTLLLMLAGPFLTIAVFLVLRVYHIVARYLGYYGAIRLAGCVLIATSLWGLLLLMVGQQGIPRSVLITYVPAATLVVVGFRLFAASLLGGIGINVWRRWRAAQSPIPVLIYGTGELAVQLGKAVRQSKTRTLIGYVDPTVSMAGRFIGRYKIYRPDRIAGLIREHAVEDLFIAVPQQSASERRLLLKSLESLKVRVRIIPDLEALASGRVKLNQLRGIEGKDLLGREEIPPNESLLTIGIENKCVLVTGAGGSIGSRLVMRALQLKPKRLILLDHSEFALYTIDRAVKDYCDTTEATCEIVSVLGSVQQAPMIDDVFAQYQIDTVFHAAAFKHVPIVEQHPLAGIRNNVVATENMVHAAAAHGVERFILISTDKAVRPKSVMGATKRVAELIVQNQARTATRTIFSSVRFGNVLESSGSVVGLFRDQINSGGPVTVTDPEVVRYFMSLDEATNLVLQAAGLAEGGEVFILDMGVPVKIDQLAQSMIRLMGLEEKTPENQDGDIEISYIGLRPGEKLVEELVSAEENATGTIHPRIWKSKEPSVTVEHLAKEIDLLKAALDMRSISVAVSALMRLVDGYVAPPQLMVENKQYDKRVLH